VTHVTTLAASARPLVEEHDALLLDLDGVVQLDDEPVAGAPATIKDVRARGVRIAFLTNNAARSPAEVVSRLSALGVDADEREVVTSAMAAADLLAQRLAGGSHVLVVGGSGLLTAVHDVGLTPVQHDDETVAAVVQGWSPDVDWRLLAEACVALRRGVPWIATNDDKTLPSPRGPLPGNGSLVATLTTATDRTPTEVVGKPRRALFDTACRMSDATRPLVVGDRLDTDIAGARAAGLPTMLVLTGVSRPRDVLAAAPDSRPSYLGASLADVTQPHPNVVVADSTAHCRDASVTADGEVIAAGAAVDGLRAAAVLAWSGKLREASYDAVLSGLGLS